MVKWVKVNNKEEHERLLKVWKNIDSIEFHCKSHLREYPFWFRNNNSRQSDNGYIERNYPNDIISFKEVLKSIKKELKIIKIW